MSLRVVFMGTPEFAVPALEAIQASGHKIELVYSQPDKPVGRGLEMRPSPVKKRALELGLPVHTPEKLSPPEELARISALKPDVIVVVAYGKILRKNWLELPRLGCVNIHSSLLPRWRGAAPIHWAMLAGDAESGVTTMKLVEELDAGDILLQARTPIGPNETVSELHDRLARMGAELILPTLAGLESGELRGTPQPVEGVNYATKLSREMEWLDPGQNVDVLARRVRALNPWPGTSVWVVERDSAPVRLKVKSVVPHPGLKGSVGCLFERSGMLLLGVADGSLELKRLQWDGKREVDAAGFLNGLKGKGSSLPFQTVPPSAIIVE
ncbi:MAG: methionyl-tRNA formyltransferase [Oligoflexia bacterium]|nr:methionyl-tRNA formyltransferase [Oligoflexia bacterium]